MHDSKSRKLQHVTDQQAWIGHGVSLAHDRAHGGRRELAIWKVLYRATLVVKYLGGLTSIRGVLPAGRQLLVLPTAKAG